MMKKKIKSVMKGAGPYYFTGKSKVGCLALHGGGGGTAWDLREFGEHCNQHADLTVHIPLLPGFGTDPEDLERIDHNDWIQTADNALNKLVEKYEKVFVVGHSLGGVLTLLLAARRSDEIAGAVCWTTPWKITARRWISFLPAIWRLQKFPLTRPIILRFIPQYHSTKPNSLWLERGYVSYDRIPIVIGIHVMNLLKILKAEIQHVSAPILYIQGSNDELISRDSGRIILSQVSSKEKELIWAENSSHALMMGSESEDVYSWTLEFIKRNSIL